MDCAQAGIVLNLHAAQPSSLQNSVGCLYALSPILRRPTVFEPLVILLQAPGRRIQKSAEVIKSVLFMLFSTKAAHNVEMQLDIKFRHPGAGNPRRLWPGQKHKPFIHMIRYELRRKWWVTSRTTAAVAYFSPTSAATHLRHSCKRHPSPTAKRHPSPQAAQPPHPDLSTLLYLVVQVQASASRP